MFLYILVQICNPHPSISFERAEWVQTYFNQPFSLFHNNMQLVQLFFAEN